MPATDTRTKPPAAAVASPAGSLRRFPARFPEPSCWWARTEARRSAGKLLRRSWSPRRELHWSEGGSERGGGGGGLAAAGAGRALARFQVARLVLSLSASRPPPARLPCRPPCPRSAGGAGLTLGVCPSAPAASNFFLVPKKRRRAAIQRMPKRDKARRRLRRLMVARGGGARGAGVLPEARGAPSPPAAGPGPRGARELPAPPVPPSPRAGHGEELRRPPGRRPERRRGWRRRRGESRAERRAGAGAGVGKEPGRRARGGEAAAAGRLSGASRAALFLPSFPPRPDPRRRRRLSPPALRRDCRLLLRSPPGGRSRSSSSRPEGEAALPLPACLPRAGLRSSPPPRRALGRASRFLPRCRRAPRRAAARCQAER